MSFFFQAEDGIRDRDVTGVRRVLFRSKATDRPNTLPTVPDPTRMSVPDLGPALSDARLIALYFPQQSRGCLTRSEERRVGKECSTRSAPRRGTINETIGRFRRTRPSTY